MICWCWCWCCCWCWCWCWCWWCWCRCWSCVDVVSLFPFMLPLALFVCCYIIAVVGVDFWLLSCLLFLLWSFEWLVMMLDLVLLVAAAAAVARSSLLVLLVVAAAVSCCCLCCCWSGWGVICYVAVAANVAIFCYCCCSHCYSCHCGCCGWYYFLVCFAVRLGDWCHGAEISTRPLNLAAWALQTAFSLWKD